jgi:glucan 1,3-beta-glucosidase
VNTYELYNRDIEALKLHTPQYIDQVYGLIVALHSLYQKEFNTGEQLLERMQRAKSTFQGRFKIGTAEDWQKILDGTADVVIRGQPDFLYVLESRITRQVR